MGECLFSHSAHERHRNWLWDRESAIAPSRIDEKEKENEMASTVCCSACFCPGMWGSPCWGAWMTFTRGGCCLLSMTLTLSAGQPGAHKQDKGAADGREDPTLAPAAYLQPFPADPAVAHLDPGRGQPARYVIAKAAAVVGPPPAGTGLWTAGHRSACSPRLQLGTG